ncbi:MAG: [FeFe] hydrogenase H-cluster radical SAM maturase HydE, partial [Synergistaceae bacterium]|nr:[FeFe] hydrogenase H-cluster radical SAM maturase HydE [Synergistaceae bacterium]
NNCLYCGIRRDNREAVRYRLTEDEIMDCCEYGYEIGFRTFVLQGGEDMYFTDERLVKIIRDIKSNFSDCAITLSLGEKERESYQKLFNAGADRYLLRHETANEEHYGKLHPSELSFKHRMKCLDDLRNIGYQTGCGMMVGSPYQTKENLVEDLMYMKKFQPQMIGIGPFIPHKDTPFRGHTAGSAEETLFLLSVIRLMMPNVLLPATTALGTVRGDGREQGILAGANVIMPNISPKDMRKNYLLYDNKIGTKDDASESARRIAECVKNIGYEVVVDRGDYKIC